VTFYRIIEGFGLEGTFKGHSVQPPLQWTATSSTTSGYSKHCQNWLWMFPGM